jgi:uncharacterized protein (DUF1330 family)
MKPYIGIGLVLFAGIGIGAAAVQSLNAQARPPVYYVAEIDVSNPDGYLKEYAPRQGDLIRQSGGRYLAAGGKTTSYDGDAPKSRIVITAWDSSDKIQAWRSNPLYKELRAIGDKYAKFRSYSVEGASQ